MYVMYYLFYRYYVMLYFNNVPGICYGTGTGTGYLWCVWYLVPPTGLTHLKNYSGIGRDRYESLCGFGRPPA